MRQLMFFFVFLMGCSSPILPSSKGYDTSEPEEEAEGWGSATSGDVDADGTDDGGGDDGPAPLENPTITLASAVCLDGTEDFWKFSLIASDPQGLNTLSGDATCEIYPVGATEDLPTHSVSMECALGDCRQNYEGADEGVMCADASTWEFRFTIMDEDGYLSTVMVVVGSVD
jgi:hypothetical protein